jgi:hypothetical protein
VAADETLAVWPPDLSLDDKFALYVFGHSSFFCARFLNDQIKRLL